MTPLSVRGVFWGISDAIRKVMTEVFDDQVKEFKDIILIADGEDHDSFPVEAAKQAGEKGVTKDALENVKNIFEQCEASRYAGTSHNSDIASLSEQVLRITKQLKKILK